MSKGLRISQNNKESGYVQNSGKIAYFCYYFKLDQI